MCVLLTDYDNVGATYLGLATPLNLNDRTLLAAINDLFKRYRVHSCTLDDLQVRIQHPLIASMHCCAM